MGIWKPVELIGWNSARIIDVFTQTNSIKNNIADLETDITIEVSTAGNYVVKIDSIETQKYFESGLHHFKYPYQIINPQLWWANNMGKPYMYEQNISLHKGNENIHKRKNCFGIRTVELVNEPDSIGTSFYFKLNGSPIFIKGANYIPQDVFLSRVTPKQYEQLIIAAKEANFNMLRVWGGGIYEKDIFYDLCDKYGILVWQDFMFSGSLYPNIPAFKENIKEEVKENIKRLRQHPCIAVWCGNNEIEVGWGNWGWQKEYGYNTSDSIYIWKAYHDIFRKLIPDQLSQLDTLRNYTPTSPLSNWGTKENFNHSSMHYWGVWHGKEPFENFKKNVGRFMVEYGFQSFPQLSTLSKVMNDSSLYLDSKAMDHRQKSYIGNDLIKTHVNQYFSPPKDFKEFVKLSQKTQAIGLEIAINSHMNKSPHCMGTLFWQFNDCWPGPSWSIIDYYGNKKDAYFCVKKAFK
jgi:beta-mannosidase